MTKRFLELEEVQYLAGEEQIKYFFADEEEEEEEEDKERKGGHAEA